MRSDTKNGPDAERHHAGSDPRFFLFSLFCLLNGDRPVNVNERRRAARTIGRAAAVNI